METSGNTYLEGSCYSCYYFLILFHIYVVISPMHLILCHFLFNADTK